MALSEREILSRLREAVVALKEVRSERDALIHAKTESIAIIGMACRWPRDSNTPESFFDSLIEGMDAVTAIPPERWAIDGTIDSDPKLQGARWGAFVKNADLFDPSFFGISPREAERMDPQQRFLLEVTWEALERAGLVPGSLVGSKTSVFVGMMNTDYYFMNVAVPRDAQDAYSATGNGHCFPAGRLAYTFGFQGPTLTLDTACSSSLVATHLACQSLRTGDSDISVVCGVNLMLDSLISELTAKTGALSSDGRCKSFDSRANGYVRGEGCGVAILKRLSDAQRDGDPIIAIIRGSAVNQDGRSTGLTTPNVLAQQAMLEQALVNAGISAEEIGYVEAHGTGTPLGDPIEMEALKAVLGKRRANDSRCYVGTVKTNVGHLEAAAGIVGLMKAALVLQYERIPKNLHLRTLNPRISLEGTPFTIPTETIQWPRSDKPRHTGVSSFGMSGTNAHIILEEAPRKESKDPPKERSAYLLPIAAKNTSVLSAFVKSYLEWLPKSGAVSLEHISYTAGARRTHHEHRMAIVARDHAELTQLLRAQANDETPNGIALGRIASADPQVVFVFSGQGSQWAEMGKQLLAEEPVFRAKLEAIEAILKNHASFSLLKELAAPEEQSRLGETEIVQPALFAMQVGLAELFKSWGVSPSAVIGHSVGEIAAAHISGAITLEDAVRLVVLRGRIMQQATGRGKMAWVAAPAAEAHHFIAGHEDTISIAAINDPASVVLSGQTNDMDAVLAEIGKKSIVTRPLRVNYAFHSPQMEPFARALIAELPAIETHNSPITMYSTVTGAAIDGRALVPEYWGRNIRATVDLASATKAALADGYKLFVEIGPHPVLVANLQQCAAEQNIEARIVSSLRRKSEERRALLETLGALYVAGVDISWKSLAPEGEHVITLPTYPWQRQKYWLEPAAPRVEIATPKMSVDDWLFTLDWQEKPLRTVSTRPDATSVWVVFMDSGRIGKNVVLHLRNRKMNCIRVDLGNNYAQQGPQQYSINADDPSDYDKLFRAISSTGAVIHGLIQLANLDAPSWDETTVDSLRESWQRGLLSTVYLTQALVRQEVPMKPRLWLISQGAMTVHANESTRSVAQAPLWGLARTIMLEHPELQCTCVDLDAAVKFDTVANLVRQFEIGDSDEHIALRPNGRFVGRFAKARLEDAKAIEFKLDAKSSYLITGGLGGLGLSVAQWMVNQGVRHIALMGRRKPTGDVLDAVNRLKSAGAHVLIVQGDVAHPDDVLNGLCAINAELPELKGIVHAAGVLADRTLLELSKENFQTVFAPKVDGAWNLHSLTLNEKLDFFVLYSSAASLLGSPGQANYAAANAYLDALAHARRARGLPAMSIQWGPFAEVGMAAANEIRGGRVANRGIDSLSPSDGFRALARLLERPRPEVGVLRLDVRRWLDSFPDQARRPLWSNLAASIPAIVPNAPDKPISAAVPQSPEARFLDKLNRAPPAEQRSLLEEHVRSQFGRVLRMDPAKIDRHEKIQSYGLDSLMAIELRNRLQTSLEVQISVADIWKYASVGELATWLGEKCKVDMSIPHSPQPEPIPSTSMSAPIEAPGSWFVLPRPRPNAKLRLICFPYAGGGAPIYSSWPDLLPPEIEVIAIQPPGRLTRIKEPLATSVGEMVEAIVPAILPYLDKPFATFGHCLGAIVMYEVVHRLGSEHWTYPIELFASGSPPPKQYLFPNILNRSDDEFLNLLRAIGLTEQNVLNDQDIMRALLPMVRGDFRVAADYKYKSPSRLDIPIVTFAGEADAFAPPNVVEGWRNETSSYFAKHSYSGGHYFLFPERESILRIVAAELEYRTSAMQYQKTPVDGLRWLVKNSVAAPQLRVFCFPGIGGTATDFQALAAAAPKGIDICVIEFPGHGALANRTPLGRVEDLALHAAQAMKRFLDRPFLFLGHDLGALVMYEVALRMHRANETMPKSLVVLGSLAPDLHYFAPIHQSPAPVFVGALQLFDVTIDEKKVAMSSVRADCAAMANYSTTKSVVLELAITAISGTKDGLIASTGVAAWQNHTSTTFGLHPLPCNHAELLVSKAALDIVKAQIESAVTTHRK